jgi:two-component system response regulator
MTPEVADVLLVEDNLDDAEFTLRALRRANVTLRIVHVHDGVAALDYLSGASGNRRPRVVLLDLKLPRLDGFEVLRRIRANAGLRTLPVVVLTSSGEARDVATSYERGANSYVVKPVEYPALIGTLVDLTRYWLAINEPAV